MNRTKNMTLALAPVCAATAFALAAVPAHATAYLSVFDTATSSYLCNVSSASDGALICDGKIGSFSFTADTGLATPTALPNLDLAFVGKGSTPPADSLEISYVITDAQGAGPTTFGTTLGGTNANGTSGFFYAGYEDDSSINFFGAYGTAGSGAFNNTQFSGPYDLDTTFDGLYEIGLFADLDLNSGKNVTISGDYNLQAYVPEPATLALFAAGLLGSALGFRRRRG